MKQIDGRRLAVFSLVGYVALAAALTLLPVSLPIASSHLPYAFALEAAVLGVAGLYFWARAHTFVSAMAYRDDLTTIANRRAFTERTDSIGVEQRGGSIGLVLFDVDGLKGFNEHCGHQAGDELLAVVGRRLAGVKADAYRVGGDEFAVIIDRNNGESALPVLRRLEPFIAAFTSCGHTHDVRLSFGFASAQQDETFPALYSRADQRLRQFKRDLYANGALIDRRELEMEAAEQDQGLVGMVVQKRSRGLLRLLG